MSAVGPIHVQRISVEGWRLGGLVLGSWGNGRSRSLRAVASHISATAPALPYLPISMWVAVLS